MRNRILAIFLLASFGLCNTAFASSQLRRIAITEDANANNATVSGVSGIQGASDRPSVFPGSEIRGERRDTRAGGRPKPDLEKEIIEQAIDLVLSSTELTQPMPVFETEEEALDFLRKRLETVFLAEKMHSEARNSLLQGFLAVRIKNGRISAVITDNFFIEFDERGNITSARFVHPQEKTALAAGISDWQVKGEGWNREFNEMAPVCAEDGRLERNYNTSVYFGSRGVAATTEDAKKIAGTLRYDVTVLPPSPLRRFQHDLHKEGDGKIEVVELNKTLGHSHPEPEIYEVLSGRAGFLMWQTNPDNPDAVTSVKFITAEKGQKVYIPGKDESGCWFHVTVNLSDRHPMVMANWLSTKAVSDYKPVIQHQGAPYYIAVETGDDANKTPILITNEKYARVPDYEIAQATADLPNLGITDAPLYSCVAGLDGLAFLRERREVRFEPGELIKRELARRIVKATILTLDRFGWPLPRDRAGFLRGLEGLAKSDVHATGLESAFLANLNNQFFSENEADRQMLADRYPEVLASMEAEVLEYACHRIAGIEIKDPYRVVEVLQDQMRSYRSTPSALPSSIEAPNITTRRLSELIDSGNMVIMMKPAVRKEGVSEDNFRIAAIRTPVGYFEFDQRGNLIWKDARPKKTALSGEEFVDVLRGLPSEVAPTLPEPIQLISSLKADDYQRLQSQLTDFCRKDPVRGSALCMHLETEAGVNVYSHIDNWVRHFSSATMARTYTRDKQYEDVPNLPDFVAEGLAHPADVFSVGVAEWAKDPRLGWGEKTMDEEIADVLKHLLGDGLFDSPEEAIDYLHTAIVQTDKDKVSQGLGRPVVSSTYLWLFDKLIDKNISVQLDNGKVVAALVQNIFATIDDRSPLYRSFAEACMISAILRNAVQTRPTRLGNNLEFAQNWLCDEIRLPHYDSDRRAVRPPVGLPEDVTTDLKRAAERRSVTVDELEGGIPISVETPNSRILFEEDGSIMFVETKKTRIAAEDEVNEAKEAAAEKERQRTESDGVRRQVAKAPAEGEAAEASTEALSYERAAEELRAAGEAMDEAFERLSDPQFSQHVKNAVRLIPPKQKVMFMVPLTTSPETLVEFLGASDVRAALLEMSSAETGIRIEFLVEVENESKPMETANYRVLRAATESITDSAQLRVTAWPQTKGTDKIERLVKFIYDRTTRIEELGLTKKDHLRDYQREYLKHVVSHRVIALIDYNEDVDYRDRLADRFGQQNAYKGRLIDSFNALMLRGPISAAEVVKAIGSSNETKPLIVIDGIQSEELKAAIQQLPESFRQAWQNWQEALRNI